MNRYSTAVGTHVLGSGQHPRRSQGQRHHHHRANACESVDGESAEPAVESGAIRAEDLEEALAQLNDPAFATMSAITMAVWGRHPLSGSEERKFKIA